MPTRHKDGKAIIIDAVLGRTSTQMCRLLSLERSNIISEPLRLVNAFFAEIKEKMRFLYLIRPLKRKQFFIFRIAIILCMRYNEMVKIYLPVFAPEELIYGAKSDFDDKAVAGQ